MSDSDSTSPTAVGAPAASAPRKGFLGRAVDSFKPPIGQAGFTPERTNQTRVYPKNAGMDPEKGPKDAGVTGTVRDAIADNESIDDNGGLHRSLGGRHLQVRASSSPRFGSWLLIIWRYS